MSVVLFLCLLGAVVVQRLLELAWSRRNQRRMAAKGAVLIAEPHFLWMALLHAGILSGAALEVILLRRPFLPVLGFTMLALFLLANLLRAWVIRTLAEHWNVHVMDSSSMGVVTTGPYRWVRHPNYVAVWLELAALPLVHTAWITSLAGSLAHLWVLARRIAVEDATLLANPAYRASMGSKPRFIPYLFWAKV